MHTYHCGRSTVQDFKSVDVLRYQQLASQQSPLRSPSGTNLIRASYDFSGTIASDPPQTMKCARNAAGASLPTAVVMLLAVLFTSVYAFAQTKQSTSTKKKTAVAAPRSRMANRSSKAPIASGRHGRTGVRQEESGTKRVRARQVVVTRKMVHGHWVRSTQIVHAAVPGPTYQTHPDQERYQQIQQALAGNGYYKGEVNGQWGDDSVSALKQFQTDHKLVNDGKISSLSLIGLGLGPTSETDAKPIAQDIGLSAPTTAEPTHN